MSYIFEIDDVTVWSPALRVGRLYVAMAGDVADMLGARTGMTAMASDFWNIDLDVFDQFVRTMYAEHFSSNHTVKKCLIGAVLAPSVIVLERGGNQIDATSQEEREFLIAAHGLSMPR
jgi:hypothetical protein